MWGWGAHTPMEFYNIYHTAQNGSFAEYSPYSNKKVDEYMDQALESQSLEESYDLWKKHSGMVKTELPRMGISRGSGW